MRNIAEKQKTDSAFYHEVCLLRLLARMGYLDDQTLRGVVEIAAEDYGSPLVLDKAFLCLFS